jgi:YggT family protein
VALRIIVDLIQFYVLVLFARIVLSWFPTNPWSPLGKVTRALATVTDPVLVPIRRILPPMRVGAAAIDLSPIVVFIGIEVLLNILTR